MGSGLYLASFKGGNTPGGKEAQIETLKSRLDAALEREAALREERNELRNANEDLNEVIGNLITGDAKPLPPGYKSPVEQLLEQMEALREDNARLIRAVCALAEKGGDQ